MSNTFGYKFDYRLGLRWYLRILFMLSDGYMRRLHIVFEGMSNEIWGKCYNEEWEKGSKRAEETKRNKNIQIIVIVTLFTFRTPVCSPG